MREYNPTLCLSLIQDCKARCTYTPKVRTATNDSNAADEAGGGKAESPQNIKLEVILRYLPLDQQEAIDGKLFLWDQGWGRRKG